MTPSLDMQDAGFALDLDSDLPPSISRLCRWGQGTAPLALALECALALRPGMALASVQVEGWDKPYSGGLLLRGAASQQRFTVELAGVENIQATLLGHLHDLDKISSDREWLAVLRRDSAEAPPLSTTSILAEAGLTPGPTSFVLGAVRMGRTAWLAPVEISADLRDEACAYVLHPSLLEPALRMSDFLARQLQGGAVTLATIGALRVLGSTAYAAWCGAVSRPRRQESEEQCLDLVLLDDEGSMLAIAEALTYRARSFQCDTPALWTHRWVQNRLREALAPIIGIGPGEVGLDQRLDSFGLDSLMVGSLLHRFRRETGREIDPMSLGGGATLRSLAADVLDRIPAPATAREATRRFAAAMNPLLADTLARVEMDKCFQRAVGMTLTDEDGREVLDFVAQFGALPFGHNPPEIWSAIAAIGQRQQPVMAGLSIPGAAVGLAEILLARAPRGLDRVVFSSSGAEAVEAAIKLCRAATSRYRLLCCEGAFHGLTLGALTASGRTRYQEAFLAPAERGDRVPFGDAEALERALARNADLYAAFIVEPVQGEGGMVVAPPGYLRQAVKLCRAAGVPLIVDEVQTGLGRTGTLFACEGEDVQPDVLTLAKALGGGLVPIGACLYASRLDTDDFHLRHGSTFGNNALGCAAAIATLEMLTVDDGAALRHVQDMSRLLEDGLRKLQARYPGIVNGIDGIGLMRSVALSRTEAAYGDSIIRFLCRSESFSFLLCSYLLNVEGLRLAPTLAASVRLRIEPP